ncbi:hypothetical protein PUNSTDRAFT_20626, partial [Punctularia strigosozonata HHB-11173 SS5]|uniref:uncharacterized protein n=1 Tax=Punctularia strigosozonata (strain HHB-11173) TaxID=741275 RepID=UPI000441771F
AAIAKAASIIPASKPLILRVPSEAVIQELTTKRARNEDNDWVDKTESDAQRTAIANIRAREAWTAFIMTPLKGKNASVKKARDAAKAANEAGPIEELTAPPPEFTIHGARLCASTQSSLYRSLIKKRKPTTRRHTAMNLDIIRWAAAGLGRKTPPSDAQIWKATRSPVMLRAERAFLYKTVHEAHRVGGFWEKIQNYENRAVCGVCDCTESIEHILTDCEGSGCYIIWRLAESLWRRKTSKPWPGNAYGTIMASCMASFEDDKDGSVSRFYKILIATSAYMIWVIRCERRIQRGEHPEKRHTRTEIHNRWVAKINQRLNLDRAMANGSRYGTKALARKTVLKTWLGALDDEESLPEDWIWKSAVL